MNSWYASVTGHMCCIVVTLYNERIFIINYITNDQIKGTWTNKSFNQSIIYAH